MIAHPYLEHYFPDFYLVDVGLYLDCKNPYAFQVQKEKIDILNETYDNIVWIRDEIGCQEFTVEWAVAQLEEHGISNPSVGGSSPLSPV